MFYWTPAMTGRFVWVYQDLSVHQSVFLSIPLSIFPPFFCSPFCLFRRVSFFGIYALVVCYIFPVELFVEFLQKNLVWAKMTKKWSKMTQKCDFSTIFKNFVVDFCLKHYSSYTNTIFGKILFLELQLVKAKALNQIE